jgi:hypothetical protein
MSATEYKDYTSYLTSLGFCESSKEEKHKIVHETHKDKRIKPEILNYTWYIYEGDLELDTLQMDTIPLIVTGNLTVNQPILEVDESTGLMVLGKTKVQTMDLSGYGYFLEGIEFSGLLYCNMHGAQRIIYHPEGPLLYNDSHSARIYPDKPEKVKVYLDRAHDHDGFGDVRTLLKEPYWQCEEYMTLEEFETDEESEYYENYEEFLRFLHFDIDSFELFNDMKNGVDVFIRKE